MFIHQPANRYYLGGLLWLVAFSILLSCAPLGEARRLFQNSKEWNRTPGEPGVKIRLTKKGINHMKTVGVKLLNEQISQLHGQQTTFPFSQPGFEGLVTLSNLNVLQYNPPEVSVVNFLPPRFIVLGLEGMDIVLNGNFFGSNGPLQVEGTLDGSLYGMTIALTAAFHAKEDGSMGVAVNNCSTIITRSHFNLNPRGPMGPLVKVMEGMINDGIKLRIPGLFCKKLKHIIEDNSPKMFAKLTRASFGDYFKEDQDEGNSILKKFMNDFVSGLIMDNKNIAQPLVTNEYFETRHKGEVRYEQDSEETPFYPRKMFTSEDSERMLYFYASDYLFNSLLYHAYQNNKLNIELNKDNIPPRYASLISTACNERSLIGSSFCIGRLIPQLAEAYPNTTASFVLVPHGLPDFEFNGDAGAIKLSSRIITYVDDHDGHAKQVMVSSVDGQADISLAVDEEKLKGDMKLNKLSIRLHRSSVAVDPTSIERLTPLAKTFIAPQLGEALRKGTNMPLKDTIRFVQPTLKVRHGFIELGTDFVLNEDAMRSKIQESFANIQI